MRKIFDGYSRKEITEEQAKETACAEYQYDDAIDALLDLMVERTSRKFCWETVKKIEDVTEKLNYKGLKLTGYFTWGKHVFFTLAGFYQYSGETTE